MSNKVEFWNFKKGYIMSDNPHAGHRKRLKQELLTQDFAETIPEHKLLEALLFYGVPRKDTNEIAHELLEHFGSICGVLEANPADLLQVKGMTENAVTLIKFILPLARRYNIEKLKGRIKFDNFELLGKFIIEKHRGYSEEILLITSFGTDGTMIACEPVRKGDKSMVSVTVKEVLKIALKHNAPAVIVSHNHMNRNALPSESDILMTMRLSNMLKEINVKLLDHIIVANNDYISMSQSGMYKSIFQL